MTEKEIQNEIRLRLSERMKSKYISAKVSFRSIETEVRTEAKKLREQKKLIL